MISASKVMSTVSAAGPVYINDIYKVSSSYLYLHSQ